MNGWPSIHNRLFQYIRDVYALSTTVTLRSVYVTADAIYEVQDNTKYLSKKDIF